VSIYCVRDLLCGPEAVYSKKTYLTVEEHDHDLIPWISRLLRHWCYDFGKCTKSCK